MLCYTGTAESQTERLSATDAGSCKSATGRIRRGEPGATPQGRMLRKKTSAEGAIHLCHGLIRAFSAGRFLFIREPGALPQASMTMAPLTLNRHRKGEATGEHVAGVAELAPPLMRHARRRPAFKLVEEEKNSHAGGC